MPENTILLVPLACLIAVLLMVRRAMKPADGGTIKVDLKIDADDAIATLRQIKGLAGEVEATFGRVEQRQQRVLGAVREAQQRKQATKPAQSKKRR